MPDPETPETLAEETPERTPIEDLKRPSVPHAEATRRALDSLRRMKPAEAKATLVRSGILTADGKLTPPYGGDEGADEVAPT